MKKFPEETQDKIEQLFAGKILAHFPYYGEFWGKFIGLRAGDRLLPYRLQIPPTAKDPTVKDNSQILKWHEEIAMRHYSQFCQLAGAHFQLEKATEALRQKDKALRHFLFWEAFDNFYQHLANTRNQMYGLWKVISNLNQTLPQKLEQYLKATDRSILWSRISEWEEQAEVLRDSVVHFSRGAAPYGDGAYWIPLPIKKEQTWSDTLKKPGPVQEATKKMERDLRDLESLLNEVQRLIGCELEKSF
ncbi:unnamed protein product, partial [marine sediment metagenome]